MLGSILLFTATAFTPITYNFEGTTIELVSETQAKMTYETKVLTLDYVIKGTELLLDNEELGVHFYFNILENNTLSLIEYDSFIDISYYHNDMTFILETEHICTIKQGDTETTATYVKSKDKLIITTLSKTYTFKIGENNVLTESEVFDVEEWLRKFFSPEQVAMIMSWVAYAGTIIGLIVNVVRLKKQNALTAEKVKDLIMKELGDKVSNEIKEQTSKSLDAVVDICNNQKHVLDTLTKVVALSQENTPESRIAVLELIAQLGVIDKENIDKSIKVVEEQKAKEIVHKEETQEQVKQVLKELDDGASI